LDFARGTVSSTWDQLDDPLQRARLIPVASDVIDACTDLLLSHKVAINDVLANAGLKPIHGKALRGRIAEEITTLLGTVTAAQIFPLNPFPEVWPKVADVIVSQISTADPEWLVLNKLLLAGYFISCRLPTAHYVAQHLMERPRAILSIRGSFIRIVESISKNGVQDAVPPISNRQGDLKLRHVNLTALLQATEAELREVVNGSGILHRLTPNNYRPQMTPNERRIVPEDVILKGRDLAFRQNEYTILAYMALGCIEQLLRAWASRHGVAHLKSTGQPRSILDWISSLPCSPSTQAQVKRLYDSQQANIRNRIMHGGLNEIENKQFEMNLSFIDARLSLANSTSGQDPYTPENIAQLCVECLEAVDHELATVGGVSPQDLAWTSSLALSASEVQVGLDIPWDLTGRDGEAWLKLIQLYLTAVAPAFTQFFRAAYIGWGRPFSTDALPTVMGLMSIFEALYRLTAHLLGIEILQIDPTRTHFQYRMLDCRTLCTPAILDRILGQVPASDQAKAREVILLAVKARNSFAHGAVITFDKMTSKGTGHLLMKSIQALVIAGLHHMKQQAAYYHWQRVYPGKAGHDLACWLASESQIYRLLTEVAQEVHPMVCR